MENREIPLPLGGLNDNERYSGQPIDTSRLLQNARAIDPTDGTRRLAQRSGLAKYNASQVSGANKIKHLAAVASNRLKVAHTSRGDTLTVDWSTATPAVDTVPNTRADRQGNVWALNGRAGLVKYNSAGAKLITITLPTTDTAHVCRAIAVDDQDNVYVAVSTGGQQSTSSMWCYTPDSTADNKVRLLWTLELAAYVESIKIKGGKLYTVQNRPDRGAAEVVVYENFTVPTPTETARFSTCYPANDMDPGIDGAVFVCGEPYAQRGIDPLAPDASPRALDWDPTMLSDWGKRAWAWVRSRDANIEDNFIVTDVTGAPNSDGGSISTWLDRTGNGRHLYGNLAPSPRTAPTLKLRGSGGVPSVFFNGTSSKMISLGNANATDQFQQASFVPGYTGAMYVIVGIGKMNTGATDRRWCFGIQTAGGSQKFFLNVDAGSGFPAAADTGSCAWYESQATASASGVGTKPNNYPFTSLHPWNAVAPTGARNLPNGWFVFSIAFTNGQAGFESWVRINGNPVDVWTSTADTWTDGFQLGEVTTVSTGTSKDPSADYAFFPGEIMEMLVLRDYRTSSGVLSLIEVNGSGGQVFPNANPSTPPSSENTEIQKLEGYIAHAYGASHVLPAGTAARLDFSGNAVAAETVTIGATTYTWSAAPGATPNAVLVGVSANASALNLIRAVNLSGTAGTTYGTGTALNASAWAFPQRFNEDADATPSILFRSLEPSSTTFTTTETMTNAAFTAATSATTLNPDAAGENTGFYPHPFTQKRVVNGSFQVISPGGPPRQADADYSAPSKAGLMNSVYGLVVKHAESGRPRWVYTSGWNAPTTAVGGVGYGLVVLSTGSIASMGPRHTTVGTDNIDVRMIADAGDTFSSTWTAAPGEWTYHYPKMAIDKYDNVFVPSSISGTSMLAYPKGSSTPIITYMTLTDDPIAYSVAVDPNYPDYPTTFSNTRPEFVFLGTEKAATGNLALFHLSLVSTASRTGSPRTIKYLAVSQGDIKTFTSAAISTPTNGASALDSSAQYISSAVIGQKIYLTDGVSYKVYDPDTDTVSTHASTSAGLIPKGAQLMCAWRNRLVIAVRPSNWYMSAVGDPANWDFLPPNAPIATMAMAGANSIPGKPSDIINALMPWNADRLLIGGDHSLRMFVGDPAAGGQLVHISETTGSGFGQDCFCKDPAGALYFWESKGGVMRFDGQGLHSLTDGRIERRMRDIDFSTYYMSLVWDVRRYGLHVFQMPYAAHSGTTIKAWFWDSKSDAWFEDEYTSSTRPTAAAVIDGDAAADRALILGGDDGYLRQYSDTATTDDGTTIYVRARIGPLTIPGRQVFTDELETVLGASQSACMYSGFMSSTPESTGLIVRNGSVGPGRSVVPMRLCGEALWVELSNVSQSAAGTRFAVDQVLVGVQDGGPSGAA